MSNNVLKKSRYFELLEKEKNLNYNFSESEFKELLSYRTILEEQITYNKREKYISLLEERIREGFKFKTDFDFEDLESYSPMVEFSDLFDQDSEDLDLLEKKILKEGITVLNNFSIDSISSLKEFSDNIRLLLHLDDSDLLLYDVYLDEEFSEEDYRILMETKLLELRDCANGTARIYNDNEVLQSVMVLFSFASVIAASILNSTLFNLIWQ